jgi:uncharacterized repeat protein (TIGR04076 family)
MQLNEQQREFLKTNFNMPDEDLNKVPEHIIGIFSKFEELSKYELDVEAIDSTYCSAGIQAGQKFTFSAMPIILKTEKSTAPLCMRALGVLTPFLNNIADKIVNNSDPNGSIWPFAECMDPGLGHGGFGKVRFKFTAKKVVK